MTAQTDRGQMVLLAAAAIAVALVPMLFAYLQLGYHPDVAPAPEPHARDVERTLERAVVAATAELPERYEWSRRDAAVTEFRSRLRSTLTALNRSALARATTIQVSYNGSLARRWADDHCPGGPDRQFGDCQADRGVVVQERAGETHVLAAAFDVGVRSTDASLTLRSVVER